MTDSKIKDELEILITQGTRILHSGIYQNGSTNFDGETEKYLKKLVKELENYKKEFHIWYPKALRCVRVIMPERLEEFEAFYTGEKKSKKFNYLSAGITHNFQGIITTGGSTEQDYFGKFTSGLQEQIYILESAKENMDDALFNYETEIHFNIFKSELDVARELKKHKQLRAAGAVAGVVLEEHLKKSCSNNDIKFRKKNPTISDYNDALKKIRIVDLVTWRLIGRCGDIRNYCVHSKERDPTPDEIDDVIRAAEKIIAEI